MSVLSEINRILADLMDVDDATIKPETYIVRDLGAESIDMLELAVSLNAHFQVDISDNQVFLTDFRAYMEQAKEKNIPFLTYLINQYPYLTKDRINEILTDLDCGPALKVKDLEAYILWQLKPA